MPDEFLCAIGKVTCVWGSLEFAVDLCVGKLAGFADGDQRKAVMVAHMTWPLKMDILETLANELKDQYPHLAEFSACKSLLKKAQDGRNRVAHGMWAYEDGQARKLRATARGKLKFSIDPITVADLDGIVRDIHIAQTAILGLVLNKD